MEQEELLLRAIHESPDDDLAWLALIEHLEERGEVERPELLRLMMMLRAKAAGPEAQT
jgi:uncharacterized protein (TIGR02996 family)